MGIVLTYTCILYKKDVAKIRSDYNEQVQKANEAKADVVRKANKAAKEARHHAPAVPAIPAPAASVPQPPVPAPQPAAPEKSASHVPAEPGEINWSVLA